MEGKKMLIPTLVIALVTCGVLYLGYRQGEGAHITGLKDGLKSAIGILPLLTCALIAVGVGTQLIPEGLFERWLGAGSGGKGYLIATVAGALGPPGGPVVIYSLVGGALKGGAGIGQMVCFITAYNLLAMHRLPLELGMLGWRFWLLRMACVIVLAPLAGLLAQFLTTALKIKVIG